MCVYVFYLTIRALDKNVVSAVNKWNEIIEDAWK